MLSGIPEKREREVPIRRLIPNLLTSTALCCGLAALHFSLQGEWDRACLAVLFSALFDALDGRAARLLRVSSRFGAVLDSLSDFLSFGVAPAMILYQWQIGKQDLLGKYEFLGVAAAMLFALCSALRLARFTSQIPATPPDAKINPKLANFFVGMPTPAAAGAALIPVSLDNSKRLAALVGPNFQLPWQAVVCLTMFIAWLMISRRPMFSFKKLGVSRGWKAPILALVGLVVALAVWDFWIALAGICLAYILSLPLSMVAYHRAVATPEAAAPTGAQPSTPDVIPIEAGRRATGF